MTLEERFQRLAERIQSGLDWGRMLARALDRLVTEERERQDVEASIAGQWKREAPAEWARQEEAFVHRLEEHGVG